MKRCSIIIHSVNGNTFIIGSALKEALEENDVEVKFYRVEDEDLHIWANKNETANDFYEDILALPVASLENLRKSDMIILGCQTRFGNVSAEMKEFMDKAFGMEETRELEDKFFACFTSCRHSVSEGSRALDSMIYWAQSLSLIHIPFGVHTEICGCSQPSQGLVHLEGKESLVRPSAQLGEEIEAYAKYLASYIQE